MATYPIISSLPPIEVDVNVSLNGDHVTPINFGSSITYEFPETLTTNKVSEVVIAELPLPFTRLRGLFGQTPISYNRRASTSDGQFAGLNGGITTMQADIATSSSSAENGGGGLLRVSYGLPHVWNQPDDPLYFPTIDFFPRYDQWFAAATWPYPFDETKAFIPPYYSIYLLYVDRQTKKVYWRTARANFVLTEIVGNLPAVVPRIGALEMTVPLSVGSLTQFASYRLTAKNQVDVWSASGLPSGLVLNGDAISGYVQRPSPGTYIQFPDATVTATNATGTSSAPLKFTTVDPLRGAPSIRVISTSDIDLVRAVPTNTTGFIGWFGWVTVTARLFVLGPGGVIAVTATADVNAGPKKITVSEVANYENGKAAEFDVSFEIRADARYSGAGYSGLNVSTALFTANFDTYPFAVGVRVTGTGTVRWGEV